MKFYKKIFRSKIEQEITKLKKKRTRNHKMARVPWRRPDLQRAQIIRSQGYPFEPWVTLFPQLDCMSDRHLCPRTKRVPSGRGGGPQPQPLTKSSSSSCHTGKLKIVPDEKRTGRHGGQRLEIVPGNRWPMAHGPWPMAQGPWPKAHGPWPKNILYFHYFGMNEHPVAAMKL